MSKHRRAKLANAAPARRKRHAKASQFGDSGRVLVGEAEMVLPGPELTPAVSENQFELYIRHQHRSLRSSIRTATFRPRGSGGFARRGPVHRQAHQRPERDSRSRVTAPRKGG